MIEESERRMEQLLRDLRQDPSLPSRLEATEAGIVRGALSGRSVHDIAMEHRVSETHVWDVLGSAARAATGQAVERTETGGLGSDTDPGVTGGYGDTAFGSLGNETPPASPEEPG